MTSVAPDFPRQSTIMWHAENLPKIFQQLQTDPQRGLSQEQVAKLRETYGLNVLTARKGESAWLLLFRQFVQPLVIILLLAAGVTAFLGEWLDSAVILGVVLLNAGIGFIQENKAMQAISALHQQLQAQATVRREGRVYKLAADDLVPGDVVLLEAGDRVPADIRLSRLRDLSIEEAALTGESLPVDKKLEPIQEEVALADRLNMAYAGTLVTRGRGEGLVIATGDRTEMGRISELISTAESLETPLTVKIKAFSRWLMIAILVLAALTFALGTLQGRDVLESFMVAVALTVGAIPEGLPAAITIMLAIGVSNMAKRQAIIRKLPAVETLGSTNVICSDKTGTLTQNQMTTVKIFAGANSYELSGVGYQPEGLLRLNENEVDLEKHIALRECLLTGLLCNDSRLIKRKGESGEYWDIEGDPTEGALLVAAMKAGLSVDCGDGAAERLETIPFASEYQYMASLHPQDEGQHVARIKGSLEAILHRSSRYLTADGEERELDRQAIEKVANALAAEGLRVLAMAKKSLPANGEISHGDIASDLTFLGLQGMIDPPRQEAKLAVQICQDAGIRVKMITGDHALTAQMIAMQLGIEGRQEKQKLTTMTGRDLEAMQEEELQNQVQDVAVFARVSPEQKLKLVRALQAEGAIVAMTGDGVNDAPALRQANIGVAMGMSGTDVAREAADMVLTDDNFASIEAAVEEGRSVFDKLTKFIVWTLPTNVGEGLIVLAAIAFATTLPITPLQILWINMATSVLLGLTLVFEPRADDIMQRPPRPAGEPILTRDLVLRTLFVGFLLTVMSLGLFYWSRVILDYDLARARTITINTIVVGEAFYLFNCRALVRPLDFHGWTNNKWMLGGVSIMLSLQVLLTYVPALQVMFGTAALDWREWLVIGLAGFTLFLLVHIEKRLRWHAAQKSSSHKQTVMA
ncbi:MAG: cation-translocating P-type ATPase [Oligoflexus sp.]